MSSRRNARQQPRPIRCIASLSLIIGSLWLASCAPADAPRDSGGKVVDLGPWRDIPPEESQLNVDSILGKKIDEYQRQSRDNTALNYRIRFDSRRGYIRVQYAPSSFYSIQSSESVRSRSEFQSWAGEILKSSSGEMAEPTKLFSENLRRLRYGFYTRKQNCLAARAGYYIGKVQDIFAREQFNAIVDFVYCKPQPNIEEFRGLFDELAVR